MCESVKRVQAGWAQGTQGCSIEALVHNCFVVLCSTSTVNNQHAPADTHQVPPQWGQQSAVPRPLLQPHAAPPRPVVRSVGAADTPEEAFAARHHACGTCQPCDAVADGAALLLLKCQLTAWCMPRKGSWSIWFIILSMLFIMPNRFVNGSPPPGNISKLLAGVKLARAAEEWTFRP